jgi:mevalonate kinase
MPTVSDCPGKVFIAGEYAVLAGGRAILAATEPRFSLSRDPAAGAQLISLHPRSPAGRLLSNLSVHERARVLQCYIADPLQGAGGFGASTAQFALLVKQLFPSLTVHDVWRLYRELHEDEPVPPSGADFFVQWEGGLQLWLGEGKGSALRLHPQRDFEIAVIAAGHQPGRKVATHDHLPRLEEIHSGRAPWMAGLNQAVERTIQWVETPNGQALGAALSQVGQVLRSQGLEIAATTRDLHSLQSVRGVLGAKGAGAMQADALVAIVEREHLSKVPEWCALRSLQFLGWLNDSLAGIRNLT